MNRHSALRVGFVAVALAVSAPVFAEGQSVQQQSRAGVSNVNWNEREVHNGISLNRLVGMDVRGKNGKSIGEVHNVIVTGQGRISAVVVESGGFMDIGDRHFRIPFEQVQFGRDMDHVIVPLSQQTAQQYRDRATGEQVRTGAGEYRLSRLKDGAFSLQDGTRAGDVEDLIATRSGNIRAVVVDTDFGPGGLRSVPFDISRFDFERGTYNAPFSRNDMSGWGPWDYRGANVAEPRSGVGATGAASGAGETGAVRGGGDRGGEAGTTGRRAPRQARG